LPCGSQIFQGIRASGGRFTKIASYFNLIIQEVYLTRFCPFGGNVGFDSLIGSMLIMNSFVFAGIIHDFFWRVRLHRVYLYGGTFLLITHFSVVFLSRSEVWRSIADWILA